MHDLFMKGKIKINRSFPAILALLFFACLVCFCAVNITSHADGKDFKIDAEMLPSGRNTYNVGLTVGNTGEDWEGTVRLLVVGTDSSNIDCAYDTAITLPKGSTKQFTVSVPKESILYISEDVWVTLLDKNMEADAFEVFKKLFSTDADSSPYSLYLDHKFDTSYNMHRLLGTLGNGSAVLSLGVLKFIVIFYVIIIGPILYMILRSKKKRDLYWAAVPAAALAGVLLVFFAGRGLAVDRTRVYSVTVYNLSDNISDKNDCKTYLHCYDAGHEEWSLRLAEGYEYIGPKLCDEYSVTGYDKYFYHVTKDGDRLFFGIKPNSGFEDGYFCAGGTADVPDTVGSIEISQLAGKLYNISGTVTNNTEHDFKYFAVLEDNSVQVYKGIPAGGTSSLSEDEILFFAESITTIYGFSYIAEISKYAIMEDTDAIAALGVGIISAYEQTPPDEIAIIGVVTDWDKAVDDDCIEISYACFYMFQ